jgi:hypothetical protein
MADSERGNHGGMLTLAKAEGKRQKAEGKRQKAKISAPMAGPYRNNCDLWAQAGLIPALSGLTAQGTPVAIGGGYGQAL